MRLQILLPFSPISREGSLNPVNIGICGLGTVGQGTVNVLRRNCAEIAARAGCSIAISHIGARRGADFNGIMLAPISLRLQKIVKLIFQLN